MARARQKKAGSSGLFLLAALAAGLAPATLAQAEPVAIEVVAAQLSYMRGTNEPVVAFRMSPAAQRIFGELTAKNVGRKLAIRVDGRVISAPVIREPIVGDSGQIASGLTVDQARDMAAKLATGRAQLEFDIID